MNNGSILKKKIMELRNKKKSYREIIDILGISKSTVSYWVAKDPRSKAIRDYLAERNRIRSKKRIRHLIKKSKAKWSAWREEARISAIKAFPGLLGNPLFVSGISLYWGEGDSKLKNPLRLGNTDPRLIRCYVSFLKKILRIPPNKIRLGLILYPDLSDNECKKFWSNITGIKEDNFMKSQFIKGYHPTKRLSKGICMVVVNSGQSKIKVLEWIDLFSRVRRII